MTQEVRRASLLRDASTILHRAGHKLCVLHGYEDYPRGVDSDLDCVCTDPVRIPRLLHEHGLPTVVQAIEHEKDSFYYVLHRRSNGASEFVALDVSADYRRDGRVFLSGAELLESRRSLGEIDAPAVDLEFACYLIKKILKDRLEPHHAQRLSELYRRDPAGCQQRLEVFFPERESRVIAEAARSGDWEHMQARIGSFRRVLLNKARRRDPLKTIRYRLDDLRRIAGRVLRPTGVAVAFLGPDGSGKSTVIDRVEDVLAPAFRRTSQFRLRPSVPKEGGLTVPVTDPHGCGPRGLALSLAKLALWHADYTLGYALRIYPRLVRSTLVLFDRYYCDLLVDPVRYRYGAPLWLACAVNKVLVRPNLVILLDAPVDVLLARKQEVSREELVRQRAAYLRLVRDLPNGHVVDASRPLDEVVAEVEGLVLDYMVGRTARRLRIGARER